MTLIDKLNRIKLHCLEQLAISSKRTSGIWKYRHLGDVISPSEATLVADIKQNCFSEEDEGNGRFIATCAGNAEAGWRGTIHGINACLTAYAVLQKQAGHKAMQIAGPSRNLLKQLKSDMENIIAVWPEELFTNPPAQ